MSGREQDRFFDLYQRLVNKAAAVDVIPPGGLTPSELRDYLRSKGFGEPDDLERVTALLERCVYGEFGDAQDCRDGEALCARLEAALPPLPTPPRAGVVERLFGWVSRHGYLLASLVIACLLFLLVYGISKTGLPSLNLGSSMSSIASDWNSAYSGEFHAAEAAQGSWTSLASNPTWITCDSDPVIDMQTLDQACTPGMDLVTAEDRVYTSRDEVFDPPLDWTHRLLVFPSIDSKYEFHTSGQNMRSAQGESDAKATIYKAIALRQSRGREMLVFISALAGGEACDEVASYLAFAATGHRTVPVASPGFVSLSKARYVSPQTLGNFPTRLLSLRNLYRLHRATGHQVFHRRLIAAGVNLHRLERREELDRIVSTILFSEILAASA